MVRPVRFAFNEETAGNNAFQQKTENEAAAERIRKQAVQEFDDYRQLLESEGITVTVLTDTPEPFTPDSIFPNNCFSTHLETVDGKPLRTLVLYPMYAENRRKERTKLMKVLGTLPFDRVIDLTAAEADGKFLEGTGALVLDREHHTAYACLSPRADAELLKEWGKLLGYKIFAFHAADEAGMAVYHTNVVMHVGTRFAVVCLESVQDAEERAALVAQLQADGKEIVEISMAQMHQFAGNMLEVRGADGGKRLIMSATAKGALTGAQIALLERDVKILSPSLTAIETAGGGSARCMIAELY
jgi:hypothetical protein